jgi:tetratricopeptide (TPR) repeat protein
LGLVLSNDHLVFVAAVGLSLAWPSTSDGQVFGTRIEATSCASAVGGNITASNVSVVCGIPPEVLDALVKSRTVVLEELINAHRETVALLKGNLDLNERQIRAALNAVGENHIPPERLAAKLVEIAERFKDLQATAFAQPGDSPKITALKADAQKAIEGGELAKASELLTDVVAEQTRSLDRLATNAAATYARLGEIALTRLRYAEAAKHFANAAAVFPPGSAHEDKRISYLQKEASALYRQGAERGDNNALRSAIERDKRLLELTPRERVPLAWATSQNHLGLVLKALGEHESGTAKLEEAVAAHREALKEQTRERVPLAWANTQNNVGNALSRLGERESGTAKLEEGVAAYREALKEWTRERVPLHWAMTQNNLGLALTRLGQRESGTAKLKEAVAAYREALKEWTRERVPLDWARAHNNLGLALASLGERESGTAKLEEAIAAHREALKERTRERVPLDWANTQTNLGLALTSLGERESGTAKLDEAVAAYREALKEQTRERVPINWAISLGEEGVALMVLAERRGDAAMAETALSQINSAFETMRDGGHARYAAYYERRALRARAIVSRLRGQ